jgi:hypothetical protein
VLGPWLDQLALKQYGSLNGMCVRAAVVRNVTKTQPTCDVRIGPCRIAASQYWFLAGIGLPGVLHTGHLSVPY